MNYQKDEDKMKVALDQAYKALELNEVPVVAAIFDRNDELIC